MDLLSRALIEVGKNIDLDGEELIRFASEDFIGGYPKNWPAGTIWEPEAKLFYSLTRILKPDIIVEVGSFVGCSSSHWASALSVNNKGILHCFDITFNNFKINSPRIRLHEGDALKTCKDLIYNGIYPDILYANFTRDIIASFLPKMKSGSIICVHDITYPEAAEVMKKGFREAVGDFFIFSTPETDCGAGYWRKPSIVGTNSKAFNEEYYLLKNPDVANAVKTGQYRNGLHHYELHGKIENRICNQ